MLVPPTDAAMVDLAAGTYPPGAVPFLQPAGFTDRLFRTVQDDGLTIFAVEGTYDPAGWLGDFLALDVQDQETENHPTLGFVHADFYRAALRLLAPIEQAARSGPVAVCGHSRGAALAAMLAGLMIDDGLAPVKVSLFAPPRVGNALFVKVLTSINYSAFRYGNDPVTEVPLTLADFPYAQVPLTIIGAPLPDPIKCHAIANYVTAVHSLATSAAES